MITGRDNTSCQECCNELQEMINLNKFKCQITYFIGDVSSKTTCQDMIKQCLLQNNNKLDVLVCNAGIYPEADVESCSVDDINETMRINYNGTVFCIQAAIEPLKKSLSGRIIIISSITGPITGNLGFAHYGASKAAQIGYMKTCAMELAKYSITVNAILPGNIITEGLGVLGDEYCTRMIERIPLGRLGKPEDIGNAAVFLANDLSSYITGVSLNIDGGQTLPEA